MTHRESLGPLRTKFRFAMSCALLAHLVATPAQSMPLPQSDEAIVGSGKEAIVGSGKEAIVGSGKEAVVPTDFVFGPVISGPVTAVDNARKSITVLGVEIKVLTSTEFVNYSLDSLALGDWISVTGITKGRNIFASQVLLLDEIFVTGVSPVFVAGEITEISVDLGYVSIAGVKVSLLEMQSAPNFNVGDYVEAYGVLTQFDQPVSGKSVLLQQ